VKTEFHPSIDCPDHGANPVVCFMCWCAMLRVLSDYERKSAASDVIIEELMRQLGETRPKCACGAVNDGSGIERHTRECLLERFPAKPRGPG
jgi:hypothetical protein